jgi:hypothetical protein
MVISKEQVKSVTLFIFIVIVAVGWDYVPIEMRPLTVRPFVPKMIHEWIWSSGVMTLTGENRRTRRKTCPSATISTTNPTGLTWAQTRADAVSGRRLTAWATCTMIELCKDVFYGGCEFGVFPEHSFNGCCRDSPLVSDSSRTTCPTTGPLRIAFISVIYF